MTTYVIGDIQGCYRSLQALLKKLLYKPASDNLWFVGDLVNRGPHSLQVVDFIMDLDPDRTKIVLGNHDLHLLAVYRGCQQLNKNDTFQDILQTKHADKIAAWLRTLPLVHYAADFNVVLCHAGIYPLWTLPEALQYASDVTTTLQGPEADELLRTMYGNLPAHWDDQAPQMDRARFIINAFTRMRLCSAEGNLELSYKESIAHSPPGLFPWFKLPQRKQITAKIIFGHWAALQGQVDVPQIWGLDLGCVWGNELSSLALETWQRVNISSQESN